MDDDGDILVLRHEPGGYRHYLLDKALHAGASLEYLSDDGSWQVARYEWSFRPESAPYLVTNTEEGTTRIIDGDTILRWPD